MKKSVPRSGSFQPRSLLKILLIMKLVIFFIMISALQAHAFNANGQSITVNAKQTEIRKILNDIERQTNFRFLYNYDLKGLRKKIDIAAENLPVTNVLEKVFEGSELTYKVLNNNLVVVLSVNEEENKEIRVTGKITGENNEPLPGVSVHEKGTGNGTTTDNNGNYSLTVANNAILEITYIGYVSRDVAVNNQPVINITLALSVKQIEQVIVIGYGSQSRKNVTSSISTVTSKDFENRPVFSAAQALEGKAAGVQVTQPSGKPGTDFSVRIRGTNSINANNDPLYVIDGIQTTDTRGLNVNDIESMQILKDAASAAIYGVDATNGVVLITTKRGKANRTQTSFNTYLGFSKLAKKIDVLNTQQYRELMDEILGPGTVDPSITTNTNWQDETFKTGINQNYQLSFSGGSDKDQFFLSLGYLKDKGMVAPARFDRYSARLNFDNRINSWLKVSTNLNYIRSTTLNTGDNASSGRGGVIMSALNTPPFLDIYKNDGSGQFATNPFQPSWENPLAYMSRDEQTKDNRLLANTTGEFRLLKSLAYKINLGIDISNSQYDFYLDPFRTVYGRQQNGIANVSRSNFQKWLMEHTLTYANKFGLHNLNILAGLSAQENNYANAYIYSNDLYGNIQTSNAGNIESGGNIATSSSLASNFGRIMYDYDSRYLFTASYRNDGSSKLAIGHKWDVFPSLSAGWRISSERFMQDVKLINDLKLRVGWGQTGNESGISEYTSYSLYDFSRVDPTNPLSGPSVHQTTIANPDLKWEKTTQTNIGVDLTFLDSRISFTADAYWKHTKDLILMIPLPQYIGVPNILRNDGTLENRGLEFAVSSRNVNKELKWNTDFNISFNTNKVTELGLNKVYDFAGIYSNNQNAIRVTVGQPLGAFYGYISQGVDPQTGMIVYADLDKNGIVTPDDRTFIGFAAPKFTYGLTNDLIWKNFDLNVFIQGVQGNDIFNATRVDLEGMFDHKNQSTVVLRRWKNPGDATNIPKSGDVNLENSKNSTRFIEDGSFLRIKSATLSYNLTNLGKRFRLQKLGVYVTAQNLLTITNYKGFDPEVNAFGANSTGTSFGVDYGTYPQTRTIIFGLNIQF